MKLRESKLKAPSTLADAEPGDVVVFADVGCGTDPHLVGWRKGTEGTPLMSLLTGAVVTYPYPSLDVRCRLYKNAEFALGEPE